MIKNLKKMSTFFIFAVIFPMLLLFFICIQGAAQNQQEESTDILAIINEEIITLDNFEQYWDMIPENYKIQLSKEDVLEQLITQTLLIQKADEINLRNDPEVAFQIKNTTDQILIQYLLEKEIVGKTILTDDDIESYYEENKEDYWQEEEVYALDILVENEEQAMEIKQQLEEGQDFTTLAKEKSIASSASAGGDIGLISKGTLMADIEDRLFALNPGEISEIIPVEQGFHIFKVVEKNSSRYLELAEVKEDIEYQLLPQRQQEAFDLFLQNLENQAVIERNMTLIQETEETEETEQEE